MSRLTQDRTAEPVSQDQILRRERGQGNIHFLCSADHEQDWQPVSVDPHSAISDDHIYIHTYSRMLPTVRTYTTHMHLTAPRLDLHLATHALITWPASAHAGSRAHSHLAPYPSSSSFVRTYTLSSSDEYLIPRSHTPSTRTHAAL